jgi:ABC-type transport system substrate-binding protein
VDTNYWKDYAAKAYRYDPAAAQQLLKEAGYPNGFNIKFYAFETSGAPFVPPMAEIIQAYWAKIGVKAEINRIEFSTYQSWRTGPSPQLVGQLTMYRQGGGTLTESQLLAYYAGPGSTTNALDGQFPDIINLENAFISETDTTKRMEEVATVIKSFIDSYVAPAICEGRSFGVFGASVDGDISVLTQSSYYPLTAVNVKHKTR